MVENAFAYGLLGALAIALLAAIFTDARHREIPNMLTLAVALSAPLYWFAAGLDPWPEMALRLAQGGIIFALFLAFFALGAMGGGDVKLIAALALWFDWLVLIKLLFLMSLAGGLLSAAMWINHRRQDSKKQLEIPYGLAIAFGGLWVIGERYFNQFT